MLCMPGSPDRKIGMLFVQKNAVPLKRQNFLPAQPRIQPQHNKYIGRQVTDRIQKHSDLLVCQRLLFLFCHSPFCRQGSRRIIADDLALHGRVENIFYQHNHIAVGSTRLLRQRYQHQAQVIRCHLVYVHMAYGLFDMVPDRRLISLQRCCADRSRTHFQPLLTIFRYRGIRLPEFGLLNLTLGLLYFVVEFLAGLSIERNAPAIGVLDTGPVIHDAFQRHSLILGDPLGFTLCHVGHLHSFGMISAPPLSQPQRPFSRMSPMSYVKRSKDLLSLLLCYMDSV